MKQISNEKLYLVENNFTYNKAQWIKHEIRRQNLILDEA